MGTLKAALLVARPPLFKVSPVAFLVCWGFAGVNSILGAGMIFLYTASPSLAVANILPYWAWGVLFLAVAGLTAYGLLRNDWVLTRRSQLFGLVLKSIWAIALVARCFVDPRTILITATWLFLAYIQAVVYIYFFPPPGGKEIE
jgi:hypothetical protein